MRVIIAGSGITVYFLAKRFITKGYQISIVSDHPVDSDYYARNLKALVIQGDPSDPSLLKQAMAFDAEMLIGITPRDQDNLVICQIAREYFQIPGILAVVNDPDNEEVFRSLGIKAVSNCRFLIETIENLSAMDDIRQQFSFGAGKVMITELEISATSRVAGKALSEVDIPASALIATIFRRDEVIIPRGATVIHSGDRIMLITLPENNSIVLKLLS